MEDSLKSFFIPKNPIIKLFKKFDRPVKSISVVFGNQREHGKNTNILAHRVVQIDLISIVVELPLYFHFFIVSLSGFVFGYPRNFMAAYYIEPSKEKNNAERNHR